MEIVKFFILIIAFCSLSFSTVELKADEPSRVELSRRSVMIEGKPFWLHSVVRRQTIYSIAQAYGVSVEQIEQNNPFLRGSLKVGMTLLVPSVSKSVDRATEPAKAEPNLKDNFIESVPMSVIKPAIEHGKPDNDMTLSDSVPEPGAIIELGVTRRINADRGINVAMLLPIGGEKNNSDANFVDFLNGSLLASGRLAEQGIKVNLDVHSTQVSATGVQAIVESGKLEAADVIIGPVYDQPFELVGRWATQRRVPIVSPLAGSGSVDNPYVICMAPTEVTKYDKLRKIISDPTANVIFFDCQEAMDVDLAAQIEPILPLTTRRISYQGKATKVDQISSLFARDVKNVVVLAVSNETLVEEILSRLSSINAAGRFEITVLGTSRWARFANMNLELFFKLKVCYVTSYHSDRGNPLVADFTRDYAAAFGTLPTSYSMRGYDVLMLVARLASDSGSRMLYDLPRFTTELLQVEYRLEQIGGSTSKFQNVEWSLVSYNPDYTITVNAEPIL